ncbi:MAG: hypothetical protein LUC43_04775 [Burkholderiales bacterium]|nr:hypothetical protein [Burkholderiales bacterium]
MKFTAIAIALAFFSATCVSAPLGVFPEEVRQICKPFKGMSLNVSTEPESVDEKFLPCLRAQVAYVRQLYSQIYPKALAKLKSKKKLDNYLFESGNIGAERNYEKIKNDLHDLILYKVQLVNDLLALETLLAPKVKYPKSIIQACNEPIEGSPWSDPCLGAKAKYMNQLAQIKLKKIIAASPDPEAVKAEQKLFDEGIEDFCAGDTFSHIGFSFNDSCLENLRILRTIQLVEMAKSLPSLKAKNN